MATETLKDKDYNLISVIYHASQACETCGQYASDAERENDKEAAGYLREVREQNAKLVEKGKHLLKTRI
jgi:hypothetical protein